MLQVASNSTLRVQTAVSRKVPGGWDMAHSFSLRLPWRALSVHSMADDLESEAVCSVPQVQPMF